jgi:von Willebrand factor type A domain
VTTSSSLLLKRGETAGAAMVAALTTGTLLSLGLASYPASAATITPRVVAVHTSPSDTSIVVHGLAAEPTPDISVAVGGRPLAATVRPMASADLSVALVIDTASDTTDEVLQATRNAATEFLFRLPEDAHSMVITAGGDPRVAAPLTRGPAAALSAVSALRADGDRSTAAGTILAAEELAATPAGPRAIVVFTNGADRSDPPVPQVSQPITQADAVIDVVYTGGAADDFWSQVVDRAGGGLHQVAAADLVQTAGRLGSALDNQYLVTFPTPRHLPAVAEMTISTGDAQSHPLMVTLPETEPADTAPPPSNREPADSTFSPTPIILAGIALLALVVLGLVLRARRRPRGPDTDVPVAAGTRIGPPTTPTPTAVTTANGPAGALDADRQNGATAPTPRRAPRGTLTAAVHGRRMAQQTLDARSEQPVRRPRHDRSPPPQRAAEPPPPNGVAQPGRATTKSEQLEQPAAADGQLPAAPEPAERHLRRHDTGKIIGVED